MMPLSKQLLKKERILFLEIFVRRTPKCHFCYEAKEWITSNLQGVSVVEYSIDNNSKDLGRWSEFLLLHPTAKSVPQVMATMDNGSRCYVGGLSELPHAFHISKLEEV